MTRRRGRRIAGLLDQSVYSFQSFLISFVALRSLNLTLLGAFTLTFTMVTLAQASLRGMLSEPLTIRAAISNDDERLHATRDAAGAALAVGIVIAILGLTTLLAPWAWAGVTCLALLALATLVMQDVWRFALFAAGRTMGAAINDSIALLVTIGALLLAETLDRTSPEVIMASWVMGTTAAYLIGIIQLGAVPRLSRARSWLLTQRDIGLPLMGSVIAQQSMGRASLALVSVIAGTAQLGALSAARTLLSPVNTMIASTYSFATPDAVKALEHSHKELIRYTTLLSGALGIVAAFVTVVLMAIPDSVGVAISGPNWHGADTLLLPTGLWILGVALSQGPRVALRALERTDAVFRLSIVLGGLLLACTAVGTLMDGARGAAWAFGIASLLGQPLWSLELHRAIARHRRAG